MKRGASIMALGLLGAVPSHAQAAPGDMTVAEFLPRADTLNAKGVMAIFSHDLRPLVAEVEAGMTGYRARLQTEKAAGHPSSCPPPKVAMTSEDILKQMHSYPAAAQATTTVSAAIADFMIKRFPCR